MVENSVACTVLVVTPHSTESQTLGVLLRQSDWRVEIARSGAEALAKLGNRHIEVVACDEDLPDGRWSDLYAELLLINHPPAFVVLAHSVDRSVWAEAINLGAADVLCTPLDETEVRFTLDRILTRNRPEVRSSRPRK